MVQPLRIPKAASRSLPANRRGRPTADQALAIDAGIRSAALDLFLEIGFAAASMDAIAARAPVSKGTLYARYESKEQLFHAVMADELERLSARAGEQDHLLPDTLAPRLRHHGRTMVAVLSWPQFKAFGRLIASTAEIAPELERAWQEIAMGRYLRFLADDIANAADTRGVAKDDAEFFASLFLHSISGWYRAESGVRAVSEEDIVAFADRVIDTIMLSIRERTSRA